MSFLRKQESASSHVGDPASPSACGMTIEQLFISRYRMNILSIDRFHPEAGVLSQAVDILRSGGIVVHPTDTCYGFAADVFNHEAIHLLYRVKQMSKNKPITVMVETIEQAQYYGKVSEQARKFMKRYWPGALTVIVPRLDALPIFFNSEIANVGFRMPNCLVSLGLLRLFGSILTTTSANISRQPSLYSIGEILAQFEVATVQPDLILDGGILDHTPASTIVDMSNNEMKILRQGVLRL